MSRVSLVVVVLALLAAGCGDDRGDAGPASSSSTAPPTTATITTTTTPAPTTTTTTTLAPPDPCAAASPFATEANLDGDDRADLVDAGWICLGTGEVFEWTPPPADGDDVAWGSDVDADGIDEILFFTHSEPPVTAAVFEFDATAPEGVRRVVADGEPFAPVYSHYTGPVGPSGESWFGCTDLDGSGVERLAVGSFDFDPAAEKTTWTLRAITWGDDLLVAAGPPVTGSFPAAEEEPGALMPGRRFCKVDELSRQIADGCSAEGLEAPAPPPELPPAAAASFAAIVAAATACDFHELERLGGDDLTLSFGGPFDIASYLANGEYLHGDGPLRVLVELLRMEPANSPTDPNFWVWPRFFAADSPATPAELAQIEQIYGAAWDDLVGDVGYLHHRVGIHADGDWLFFVAGD